MGKAPTPHEGSAERARTSVRISNAYLSPPAAGAPDPELSAGAAAATPAAAAGAAEKMEPRRVCFWVCFLASAVERFCVMFTYVGEKSIESRKS